VVRYKRDLTTDQVQRAVESLCGMGWEWALPSSVVVHRALEIARAREATVWDATSAAPAESLNATYVTADEQLVRRLGDLARFLGEVEDI